MKPNHPDTLGIIQNLAIVYRKKGRYNDAEELYKRALANNEEKLGPDHPDTLRIASNFAICLQYLGRVSDADLLSMKFGLRKTKDAEDVAYR